MYDTSSLEDPSDINPSDTYNVLYDLGFYSDRKVTLLSSYSFSYTNTCCVMSHVQ